MTQRLVVALGAARSDETIGRLRELEPRIDIQFDRALYKAERSPAEQAAFEAMLDSADALFGIPDWSPEALARVVRSSPRLRWVHSFAAGGGQAVREAGLTAEELERVQITTSAGAYSPPLAEFALFGVVAGAKQLPALQQQQRDHRWGLLSPMRMLDGLTVLVVGLGGIGRESARLLSAVGCRVIGVHRHPVEGFEIVQVEALVEAVASADAIVLTLPETEQTIGMISAAVLDAVKPGVTIVNVGRGSAIDEPAMIRALEDGRVGFAALDVTTIEPLPADSPLWDLPNVVISPHSAASSAVDANDRRLVELFAENATRLLDGRELLNRVSPVEFY